MKCPKREEGASILLSADDLGMHPAVNAACFSLLEQGVAISPTLMAVGPAFDEAIEGLNNARLPKVGAHLVLTSEYERLPYFPLTKELGELLQQTYGTARFPAGMELYRREILERCDLLAAELRAQIERILQSGLGLSHVDGHMFFYEPSVGKVELLPIVQQIQREYQVPMREWFFREHSPVNQRFFIWEGYETEQERHRYYREIFAKPPLGVSEIILHPGSNLEEMQQFSNSGMRRYADFRFFAGEEFRNILKNASFRIVRQEELWLRWNEYIY